MQIKRTPFIEQSLLQSRIFQNESPGKSIATTQLLINAKNQVQFTNHLQFHYLWLDARSIDLNNPKQQIFQNDLNWVLKNIIIYIPNLLQLGKY